SGFAMTQLLKFDEVKKLEFEAIAKSSTETTLFLLHLCDRELFGLVGADKRKVIMDGVLEGIEKKLEAHDDKVLKQLYGEQTKENLAKHFKYLSTVAFSVGFHEAYKSSSFQYPNAPAGA
ncbi:MAG: hypothetical protein HQL15_08425, partial [Candidatus Omnitrophica bacterium]|nr:hypothetical protein [Candidatus Omnitrophota bacterium]